MQVICKWTVIWDYFFHIFFQWISQESVYFRYYLCATSYMLLQLSAYNLLLLCLILHYVSLFSWKVYVIMLLNKVHIAPEFPARLQCYGFANGSLVNTISRILAMHSISLIHSSASTTICIHLVMSRKWHSLPITL